MTVLGDLTRIGAERYPDRVAIADEVVEVTYGELHAHTDALASALRERGLHAGDRVAVLIPNTAMFFYAYFATLKLGAIVVPIGPRLSPNEIQFLMDHTGASALIYDESLGGKLASLTPPSIVVAVGTPRPGDLRLADLLTAPVPEVGPQPHEDDLAALFYTSGTTADPKGVELTHSNILKTVEILSEAFEITDKDVGLCPISLTHTTLHFTPVPVLAAGGKVLVLDRFRPEITLELLERHRVSLFPTVTAVAMLVAKHAVSSQRSHDLAALRKIFLGGANVPASLVEEWQRLAPNCSAVNCYGLTEMDGPVSCMDRDRFPFRSGSVGRPYPGVDVRIVTERGTDADLGQIGEILACGGNMMRGYWKNPSSTSQALRGGWLHTGDLGYLDADGYLFIAGREKDVMKRGGETIFPDEIENALIGHAAIKEAVVVAAKDDVMGERIVAVLAPQPGAELVADDITAYCAQRLADFKVPEFVGIIEPELPKNAVGKVDRKRIQAAVIAGELLLVDRRRGSVRIG
jgi:acyl-CoA synthetase (AMP-forming)/AMP-acid ligase II